MKLEEAQRLLELARKLKAAEERDPLDFVPWLPGQIAWLSDPGPRPKLFRAGVRSGKTLAGVQEVIGRATGRHPFREVPQPPVRIAFITTDKQAQGVAIMRLFWEFCPKYALADSVDFNNRTGFRGHVPVVEFKNGSTVTWYSNNAGPKALQGSEFDYIQIDEPPDPAVFDECLARVRNTGGQVGLSLTPLHRPCEWLKELTEKGRVADHHYRLTLENQTSPLTGEVRRKKDGTFWDQAFIDHLEELKGPDAPIELHGEWENRTEGRYFDCFDPERHVSAWLPSDALSWQLGVDYASANREHGTAAVLSAVLTKRTPRQGLVTTVYAVDEVTVPGSAPMGTFAREVIAMLHRHGFRWSDLDKVFGDIASKSRRSGQVSSNRELQTAVAAQLGHSSSALRPRIENVKEGGGASGVGKRIKDIRSRWAYNAMARGRVFIHPRCELLIEALNTYDYDPKHKLKDLTDAWMYGLKPQWTTRRDVAGGVIEFG